jgi:hypothetical protein
MGIFHIDLVYETNRHIIEIVCHLEYQMFGIDDTRKWVTIA